MRHRMVAWVRLGCGVVAFAVLCSLAVAQPPPATDGLTWLKDYPKSFAVPNGPAGKFWISSAGGLDSAKYKDIRLSSETCMMEVVQLDAKGKEVAGSKKVFKGVAEPGNAKWSANTVKELVNGKEVGFAGFDAGKYRVKVETKVKESMTAAERAATIETTLDVK